MEYHKPVLLNETVEALLHQPEGIYVDCTFGGGGHSREIVSRLAGGKLYAFDQDQDALANVFEDPKFELINQNFRHLQNALFFVGVTKVDGVMADLGVSSHQFDAAERGFSIRADAPLDMRMNVLQPLCAKTVVNEYEEEALANILYYYGELRESRRMARDIVAARKLAPIETTNQLKKVFSYIPDFKSNKVFAQLFQAIRIEVNQELEALKEMLLQSYEVLKPGGRLVIISYHSLEDRLVKKFLKNGMFEGEPQRDIYGAYEKSFDLLQSKAIVPNEIELQENPRSRSARLRVGIKR
jgi:16S rRNA (cytosine1402-N4)-methyltransferase